MVLAQGEAALGEVDVIDEVDQGEDEEGQFVRRFVLARLVAAQPV